MEKTMMLNVRVSPSVKQQAEDLLKQLGIPMATAIDMYLRQITLTGGIPFSLALPKAPAALNADTCLLYTSWVMRFLRGGGLVALLPVVQQVEIIGQHPQTVGDVCPLLVRQATLGRRQSDGIGGRLVRVKPEVVYQLLGGLTGVQVCLLYTSRCV